MTKYQKNDKKVTKKKQSENKMRVEKIFKKCLEKLCKMSKTWQKLTKSVKTALKKYIKVEKCDEKVMKNDNKWLKIFKNYANVTLNDKKKGGKTDKKKSHGIDR